MSGCAINKPWPVEGWPELETTVHRLPEQKDVRDYCATIVTPSLFAKIVGLGVVLVEACSWADLCARTCDVWVAEGDTFWTMHELQHCRGHDHVFDSTFEDLLESVKQGACK
jgi:hypothetical protein